jgi:hypothetical protein
LLIDGWQACWWGDLYPGSHQGTQSLLVIHS